MTTMSARSRVGPFRSIWNYMKRQVVLKKETQEKCVGVDKRGNKYFLRNASKEFNIRESRYVIPPPKDLDSDMIPMAKNVPPEWDAWLRGRRPNPPTEEEIHRIKVEQLKMQQRVKELEMKERMELGESVDTEVSIQENDSQEKITKTIEEGDTSARKPFPTYDDFEINPGQFAKKKRKG